MTPPGPGRTTVEIPDWVAALSDRGVQAGLVLAAIAAAGFAGLGIAWSGVAATLLPQVQMPYLVSGAIGGTALAGAVLAILATHVERRNSAADRAQLEAIITMAAAVTEDLPAAVTTSRRNAMLVRNGRTLHRRECRVIRGKRPVPLGRQESVAGLRSCGVCRPDGFEA